MLKLSPMYAIAFDLKKDYLEEHYGSSPENAYGDIKRVLAEHGFQPQQGSVYYGDETSNVVKTIVAVQDLSRKCPWFKESVRDIRILQLLGSDDLKPLL